jgi:AcrR family transcriptional regulator
MEPEGGDRGRRERERRGLILDAARELLIETGVQSLTIEGVAARAGVAKTTIYRRWRSRDDLAFAVLLELVELLSVPDLGDTRSELVYLVDSVVRVLDSTLIGGVMQGLVPDLASNPERRSAFREQVVGARVVELRRVVERGVARGDLRPDADVDLMYVRAAARAGLLPPAPERRAAGGGPGGAPRRCGAAGLRPAARRLTTTPRDGAFAPARGAHMIGR